MDLQLNIQIKIISLSLKNASPFPMSDSKNAANCSLFFNKCSAAISLNSSTEILGLYFFIWCTREENIQSPSLGTDFRLSPFCLSKLLRRSFSTAAGVSSPRRNFSFSFFQVANFKFHKRKIPDWKIFLWKRTETAAGNGILKFLHDNFFLQSYN